MQVGSLQRSYVNLFLCCSKPFSSINDFRSSTCSFRSVVSFPSLNRGLQASKGRLRQRGVSTQVLAMGVKERSITISSNGDGPPAVANFMVFETTGELQKGLAEVLRDIAAAKVREKGSFTVALSGGSIVKLMGTLATEGFAPSIDWTKWYVLWADERAVKLDHPDSNYKGAWDEFLAKVPIPRDQILAINDGVATSEAAADYEVRLRKLVSSGVMASVGRKEEEDGKGFLPRIDVVLLGMGPDGHVASLFPGHPLLEEKDRWVAPIFDSPKPPPERITLSMPVINSAENVIFVATGAGKAEMLARLGQPSSSGDALPFQLVRPTNGALTWIVDEPAFEHLGRMIPSSPM